MPSPADRTDFYPQRDAGGVRSFGLALLAHAGLLVALTWGVSWNRSDPSAPFAAELWASVPQEAAPKLVEPTPPPQPPPQPPPTPVKPTPEPKVPEVKTPPPAPKVDIALEQEKKRKLKEQEDAQAKLKVAQDVKKLEAKKLQEKEQAATAALDLQRKQNLERTMGLAGATGNDSAKGSALVASGPSANYQSKLAALFKRNITFSNAQGIQGNPRAVVQVKVSSTGLIMSSRLTKSSGVPAWDEAVLRAVEKTERIPLDENGRVVADFPIEFGPKD